MLDGVRGLAVLMVLACHLLGRMPAVGVIPSLIAHVAGYGGLGVDVFFVLSGYLITGILLRSRSDKQYYRNFYARRVLRIFPLYYGTLFALLIIAPGVSIYARQELAPTLPHQAWAWLYAVNFFYLAHPGSPFRYLDHFWSLAVEEHFYFLWPLVVHSLSGRTLGRTCLILAAVSCCGWMVATAAGMNPVATATVTPLHVDTLCLGALLAVWTFENRERRSIMRVAAIAGAAALTMCLASLLAQRFAPSHAELARTMRNLAARGLLWAAFAGLLVSSPRSWSRRLFSSATLRFFGKYSYGIYVFHAILGLAAFRAGTVENLATRVGSVPVALGVVAGATVIVSVLMAMVSYRFFESPLLALKTRFVPGRPVATIPALAPRPAHAVAYLQGQSPDSSAVLNGLARIEPTASPATTAGSRTRPATRSESP